MHRFSLLALALLCAYLLFSQDARVLMESVWTRLQSDCLELRKRLRAGWPHRERCLQPRCAEQRHHVQRPRLVGDGMRRLVRCPWRHQQRFHREQLRGLPLLLGAIETINPELNTATSICHWSPINDYIQGDVVSEIHQLTTSDQAVADAAGAILTGGNPHAMFLHFDDVDLAGHSYGFSPQCAYIDAIETVDGHLAEVLSALTSRAPIMRRKIGSSSPPPTTVALWLRARQGNPSTGRSRLFGTSGPSVDPELVVKDTLEILPPPELRGTRRSRNCNLKGTATQCTSQRIPCSPRYADQDFTIEVASEQKPPPTLPSLATRTGILGSTPVVFSFRYPNGPAWKVNGRWRQPSRCQRSRWGFGRPMAHAVVFV